MNTEAVGHLKQNHTLYLGPEAHLFLREYSITLNQTRKTNIFLKFLPKPKMIYLFIYLFICLFIYLFISHV